MTREEALKMLLKLNLEDKRLNTIRVSEIIIDLNKKGNTYSRISNEIGMDRVSIERYANLLDFDWDKFNRETEKYNNGQTTLF